MQRNGYEVLLSYHINSQPIHTLNETRTAILALRAGNQDSLSTILGLWETNNAMSTQRYSVTQHPISTLITWINSGEIAIPEIQRPFVWKPTKVRDLMDSLLNGYPVGYLIAWRNPTVKLKDGSLSAGKRILIDGQQRITALMAALLGQEVITKDYRRAQIRIAFQPLEQKFEVYTPIIARDASWIPDITVIFDPSASLFNLVNNYCAANPGTSQDMVFRQLETLSKITTNPIGLIELDAGLDIETVTEIFIRVNSEGVPLSQADFAMSKMAANEKYNGHVLRKAIDYFSHLATRPEFYPTIQKNDVEFANTDYFSKMAWLRKETDDLYDPSYTDVLRVSFASEFRRGRLEDLVALLSGRNFETRQYEDVIVEDTFSRLSESLMRFMNETNFKQFIMILRSAGFVDSSLVGSQNNLNMAYILYLTLRDQGIPAADIECYVRRWFVMSMLTGRYSSGAPEGVIDFDIRQIDAYGIDGYFGPTIESQLPDAFWNAALPQEMDTSAASNAYFRVFQAAQVKLGDRGFLSRDFTVQDLIEVKSDVHHVFPKDYLKKHGKDKGQYNQIANYVVAQSEINIAIGNKEPAIYMSEVYDQVSGGMKRYGNITDPDELAENLWMNCIPDGIEQMTVADYPTFLAARRQLIAQRIKAYFETL